jgi:hypothetical protein
MEFDINVLAKLLAPALTGIVGLIAKGYLEARPKLITYLVHASAIPLHDEKNTNVNTHSIVVRNAGRRTAHNIRIGHNFLPAFQIHPQLAHEVIKGEDGSAEIIIPTLVPSEQINISYLYFPPHLWSQVHSHCKSDEMAAKYINIMPAVQPSKLQLTVIWGLMFVGASTLLYWVIYWLLAWVQRSAY